MYAFANIPEQRFTEFKVGCNLWYSIISQKFDLKLKIERQV